MRRGRLLLLLALALAGCAQPEARLRTVSLEEPRAADACAEKACSWEWWNLTVEGAGWRQLEAPIPYVHLRQAGVDPSWDAMAWERALVVDGRGSAHLLGQAGSPRVAVDATGPFTVTAHRVREAGPTGFAEDFLHARWGPLANHTRPPALDVRLLGSVESVRVTYEAHGAFCERRAAYALGATTSDATFWLPGRDGVTCR